LGNQRRIGEETTVLAVLALLTFSVNGDAILSAAIEIAVTAVNGGDGVSAD